MSGRMYAQPSAHGNNKGAFTQARVLNGFAEEDDEFWMELALTFRGAARKPVRALRTAASKLDDGEAILAVD